MTLGYSNNRRKMLGTGSALAVASFFGISVSAFATLDDVNKAIGEFAGGVEPATGKILLTIPEIAEDGNIVPVSFTVDSPMSKDDYVESVMILAPGNPNPTVATMHFSTLSGKAAGTTRMRLAETQDVIVVAKMNDGSLFKTTRHVTVVISGCGGQEH